MFECKFEAAVVSAVQAVLAAEDIVSLDDILDALDEARIGPRRCVIAVALRTAGRA